ncbi:MAG: GspE/PulE family protein [Bacillota bacterium]
MAKNEPKRLGDLLIEFNFITEDQLMNAIEKQKTSEKRLGDILVDLGYIKEEDLIQVLEFQLGIPHVNLNQQVMSPTLAQHLPENLARRFNAVPLGMDKERLKVAMVDPSDLVAIDDIEITMGYKVEPYIASRAEIKKAISQIYSVADSDTTEIFASLDESQEDNEPALDELKQMVDEAPIVKLTNLIISQAVQFNASDIHIDPQENEVRIRYRIDGVLIPKMSAPKYSQAALISRLKIIADLDITKRRIPQDGRIQLNVKGIKVDMRVSTLPTIFGEKVVIRLLNRDESLLNINKLGFSETNIKYFKDLIARPHGIILVTGPTGSGKSTTLCSALNELNSPEQNIITIEDPVEYQIKGINQVQANQTTGLTFADTLRSILRQDPDIIMVGEIRDEETARIAIRAALTGHLVLSTLHTNDAVSSITRLLDMGLPAYMVASTIIGVVAQRLVRRLCTGCKEDYEPGLEEQQLLNIEPGTTLYKPDHCKRCTSGYKGRLAVHEILMVNNKIKDMIIKGANEQELKTQVVQDGMITLEEDGKAKVKQGLTSYEELLRVVV